MNLFYYFFGGVTARGEVRCPIRVAITPTMASTTSPRVYFLAMALLLSCDTLSKPYASRALFDGISMGISDGERLGLIGPNGSGKSTLLKIFAGVDTPDLGVVSVRRNTRVAYLAQDDSFPAGSTVNDVLVDALKGQSLDDIEREVEIGIMLGQVGFDNGDALTDTLSGGWRKRLALARSLLTKPDLLLLDEPTNHLDIDGILWLEKLLKGAPFGFVLISHDRYFLENVTNRTIELNRAYPTGFLSVDGNYSTFLEKREELLAAQQTMEVTLKAKVAKEIDWLRRGPPARTTKAQYRIDEAGRMMQDLSDVKGRNNSGGAAGIDFAATGRKTQRLLVVDGASKSLGDKRLFSDLSFVMSPGMKLGLIGPNGSGKTSLIKTLCGEIAPDTGTIKPADRLNVVVFDQKRHEQLDLKQSLRQALAGDNDTVNFNGGTIHVASWSKRFLFRPEQLEVPISRLSGGEQARILIARLMLQPADLLVLDEPTNDLDIASLEVLEESLQDFPGAMILVTHDRYLIESVATEILSLDGRGGCRFFADYRQWERANISTAPVAKPREAGPPRPKPVDNRPVRLTRPEQRELDKMEEAIMEAEGALESLQALLNDPAVVADYKRLHQATADIDAAQAKVSALYSRWEELEAKKAAG